MSDEHANESAQVRWIGLILGPLLFTSILWLMPANDLSPEAHRVIAIVALTICWWITEPIPIPATGLFSVVLAVLIGAVPIPEGAKNVNVARIALAPFADPSVYFLLGGMFLARAMTRHGLDERLALAILCSPAAGRSPASLLTFVGLSVATVSIFVSNTAATAMAFPVVMGMIDVLAKNPLNADGDLRRSRFTSSLLMMTAYASSIGGVTTPIGTATNVVALGYFRREEFLGRSVDFASWAAVGVPIAIILFLGNALWLRFLGQTKNLDIANLRDYLRLRRAELGPMRRGEINTLLVLFTVVVLWLAPSLSNLFGWTTLQRLLERRLPEEMVAVLAPVLLFLIPVDLRKGRGTLEADDLGKVDWGSMILFGSGLSLGSLMFASGLAQKMGERLVHTIGTTDPWVITLLAIIAGLVLSEFTSNSASAATLLPVVLSIAKAAEIDPAPALMGVTFASSFGSLLPVSTPPNAIVYGSGLLSIRRMMLGGIGLDVLAVGVIWTVLRVAYGLGWRP